MENSTFQLADILSRHTGLGKKIGWKKKQEKKIQFNITTLRNSFS